MMPLNQDWRTAKLFICPPEVSVLSDEDSADEEPNGSNDLSNLCSKQLQSEFELRLDMCGKSEEVIVDNINDIGSNDSSDKIPAE